MTRPARVSVVIPCFNHGEFLPEAVVSVGSLGRGDTELIVVDDGSTDEQTRRELDKLVVQGVKVIRQENKGLASARNAGISASIGEYILPLDADNRLRSGYIQRGIEILEANTRVGIVYGDAEYIGARTGRWRVGPFDEARLLDWNYIDACAVYRRSVWEQNGGYDATMPVQGLEDWDFWLGSVKRGWKFVYVPEVLFDYRISSDSMITRTWGFEPQIAEFVGNKHGSLYRQRWATLANEDLSIRQSTKTLTKLIVRRVKRAFGAGPKTGQAQR
jgi:glycosyltransferase involved in cell wall biosynthesis